MMRDLAMQSDAVVLGQLEAMAARVLLRPWSAFTYRDELRVLQAEVSKRIARAAPDGRLIDERALWLVDALVAMISAKGLQHNWLVRIADVLHCEVKIALFEARGAEERALPSEALR